MQAPMPVQHYHHAWLIWLLYFTGVALHVALQIDDIARKNGWTRKAVLNAIGPAVAFRTFGTAMIFGLIWHYPEALGNGLKMIGVNLGPDETEVLAFPMNNFVAGLYGLGLDVMLGYIPGLKSWLPDVNAPWNGVDRRGTGRTPAPPATPTPPTAPAARVS